MKRSENHFMILNLIVILTIVLPPVHLNVYNYPFENFYGPFESVVDQSAAKTCFMLNGQLSLFNANADQQGHKCTYTANVWTKDNKAAEEFCASNTPYPVIRQLAEKVGSSTKCGYLITLKCMNDWWQIDGLCYKVLNSDFTFSEAKATCAGMVKEAEPKLAEFYSTPFGMFLEHMIFSEVWVTVPYITEYFLDGVGEAAVFVNDGAFKYDTKQGTLILQKENTKHQALCQYKPATTVAENYRRAREYEEIYPIYVQDSGINVVTSSYLTVYQKDTKRVGNLFLPKFDTMEIRERCKTLGKVIGVESYPLLAIETEWIDIRSYLKDHRFYLTSAFKNDGCKVTDYQDYDVSTGAAVAIFSVGENTQRVCNAFSFSFNEKKRAPSMAGMRAPVICALHAFTFEQAQCDPGWIPFDRNGITRFCHFAYNTMRVPHSEAKAACLRMNAALSGFDSAAEINTVRPHLDKTELNHFWLGGVIPCEVDCQDGFMASWDEGVARNTALLNNYNHAAWNWSGPPNDIISYRPDNEALHTHYKYDKHFKVMYYICGKYAGFSRKKILSS